MLEREVVEAAPVAPAAAMAGPVPRRGMRLRAVVTARRWNLVMRAWPAVAVGVLGYTHRWMSDDGLIYTRTVRQILAGHGPVFNPGERAEASTSALWQWILAAVAFVTRANPALLAVFLGLALTVAGLYLAVDGAMRLHGRGRVMLPAGAMVMVALPPVWDFATSGLETGLTTCWIAVSWRALVMARRAPRRTETIRAVVLAGLGPLVRPDLTILTVALLAGLWLLHRPGWRATLKAGGLALASPLAYEVFRAGYYGELVPLPALTKTAGTGHWARGVVYLSDFTGNYGVWVALVLAAVIADQALRRTRGGVHRPELVAAAVPVVAGGVSGLYVTWIGGDFMSGRMLLPALLMLLLPVLAVPATRRAAVPVALLAAWTLVCGVALRLPYTGINAAGISNERLFYADQAHVPNPDSAAEHAAGDPETKAVDAALTTGRRILMLPDGVEVPLRPDLPAGFALTWPALGINGVDTPLGDDAIDPMGLGYPLAAHLEVTAAGRAGHDKWIPDVWIVADYGDPAAPTPSGIDPGQLAAARAALQCGALAQIQASARKPMTLGRFLSNLWRAAGDTEVTFPADPYKAEEEFCTG
jgi:arabinofuranosyltransferase